MSCEAGWPSREPPSSKGPALVGRARERREPRLGLRLDGGRGGRGRREQRIACEQRKAPMRRDGHPQPAPAHRGHRAGPTRGAPAAAACRLRRLPDVATLLGGRCEVRGRRSLAQHWVVRGGDVGMRFARNVSASAGSVGSPRGRTQGRPGRTRSATRRAREPSAALVPVPQADGQRSRKGCGGWHRRHGARPERPDRWVVDPAELYEVTPSEWFSSRSSAEARTPWSCSVGTTTAFNLGTSSMGSDAVLGRCSLHPVEQKQRRRVWQRGPTARRQRLATSVPAFSRSEPTTARIVKGGASVRHAGGRDGSAWTAAVLAGERGEPRVRPRAAVVSVHWRFRQDRSSIPRGRRHRVRGGRFRLPGA